jgi:acyl-CoA reductase-like NAD-dependent aldehyde dehydrogenase
MSKRKLSSAILPLVGSVGPWRDATYKASRTRDVIWPFTGEAIARVELATAAEVDHAVASASAEFPRWAGLTMKRRAQIMLKFHALVETHKDELIDLIVRENGKNRVEAAGDVAKGLETVEWACSMPQIAQGRHLTVSSGVTCHEIVEPIGVVASIVPFNFPFMVRAPRARLAALAARRPAAHPARAGAAPPPSPPRARAHARRRCRSGRFRSRWSRGTA